MADKHYETLDRAALEAELRRVRDQLEDVEETFNFRLTHTNAHLPDDFVFDHEHEMEELREKVRLLEVLLSEPGAN